MSLRASGHIACYGEAIGRWLIWRAVMKNGLAPPKPLLAGLSPDERAAIFGGNAARIYLSRRGRNVEAV